MLSTSPVRQKLQAKRAVSPPYDYNEGIWALPNLQGKRAKRKASLPLYECKRGPSRLDIWMLLAL